MGKQDSPRSPRPETQHECLSLGMKDYQKRSSENSNDPYIGRRMFGGDNHCNSKMGLIHGLKNDSTKCSVSKGNYVGKRHIWLRKHVKSIAFICLLMGFLFLLDSVMVSIFDSMSLQNSSVPKKPSGIKDEGRDAYSKEDKSPVNMYEWLLNLASNALAEKEFKQGSGNFWREPFKQASVWKPCADKLSTSGRNYKSNGYILVSANGGLNQQRVAICNAVAVASLLNATLVLPRFLYSNVWKDPRSDI